MKARTRNIPESFSFSYDTTYPFDGFDVAEGTVNGKKISEINVRFSEYISNPWTRATSFLGIKNRMRRDHRHPAANAALNMIGWPEADAPLWQKVISYLLIPFTLAWNLLMVIPKIVINIARLFTEFLPLSLALVCDVKAKETKNSFGHAALTVIRDIFKGLYFIGRAITNPITAMKASYYENDGIRAFLVPLASALITIVSFAIIIPVVWPYAVQFITGTVVPFLTTNLPAVIVNAAQAVINFVSPAVTAVFTAIGNFFAPVVTPMLEFLGLTFLSPAVVGVAAVIGALVTTVGVAIQKGIDVLNDLWHNNRANKVNVSLTVKIDAEAPDLSKAPRPSSPNSLARVKKKLSETFDVKADEEAKHAETESTEQRSEKARVIEIDTVDAKPAAPKSTPVIEDVTAKAEEKEVKASPRM